jgi:hypothetical protein
VLLILLFCVPVVLNLLHQFYATHKNNNNNNNQDSSSSGMQQQSQHQQQFGRSSVHNRSYAPPILPEGESVSL